MNEQERAALMRARYGQNWQNIQGSLVPRATQESPVYSMPRSNITTFARTQKYKKSTKKTKGRKTR
jgi:hypothetical protein